MPPASNVPPQIRRFIPNGQNFITLIKRHIIGLVYIYLIIIAAVAAAIFIAAMVAPDLLEGFSGDGATALTLGTFLIVLLLVIVLILVTNIYLHNSLIITDQEIIQVLQRGVFQVKVSHLSHADIEDVTSDQSGLLPTLFNYGTLRIETSGEMRNFDFSYCPDPSRYARVVLEARQKFTETTGG
jgi:hypothetical protein